MNQVKVTVITVTFNCVSVLEKTIQSVLSQTLKNIEYIIIDGGSTDGTVDLIEKYKSHLSFWCSEKDNGIFDAMNKGVAHANGEWVNFMNAGDLFYDENILETVFTKNDTSKYDFIFGDNVVSVDNREIYKLAHPFFEAKGLFKRMGFNHQSVFVRTNLARKYPFDLQYKIAADYNMINKIYEHGGKPLYVNKPLSVTNLDGVSAKNRCMQQYEEEIISGANKSFRYKIYKKLKTVKKKLW